MNSIDKSVTFVVPISDRTIYRNNFLASPLFKEGHQNEILAIENAPSASKFYNWAIDNSSNDILIFAHQDVLFPTSWLRNLEIALQHLEETDPFWGVLGCWGHTRDLKYYGYVYCAGNGIVFGHPFDIPITIQTLDEIVLIIRKSSDLHFDETLPYFHFYGTDICMAAADRGMNNYAISAFCFHNSNKTELFPKEFLKCYFHIKKRWRKYLPIKTPCIEITRFNYSLFRSFTLQILRYLFLKREGKIGRRVKNPLEYLEILERCDANNSLWHGKKSREIFPGKL